MKTKILYKILLAIVIIAAIGGAAYFGLNKFGVIQSGIRIMDTPTVVQEIKKISELSTMTYVEDLVLKDTIVKNRSVKRVDVSRVLSNRELISKKSVSDRMYFVQVAEGRIRAGFDLTKIEEGDIKVEDNVLFVTLPKAEILDVIMNPSDITPIYDEKSGSWSEAEIHQARTELLNKGLEQIEQRAIEDGILQKAEDQGQEKFKAMFKFFGFEDVIVSIKQD